MIGRTTVAVFAFALAASVLPLAAHHSVAETFDTSREITIRGVVSKVEWKNPHTLAWIDVKSDNGIVSSWEIELAPPNALKRKGGSDFIKAGDQLSVVFWQAKDGSKVANPLTLTFSDGRVINYSRDLTNDWKTMDTSRK